MIAVAAAPVLALAVLGVEVQLARMGPDLPSRPPFELDGRVGGSGPPLRMVWLGDSTAAGVGVSELDRALPRLVATGLDRPVELTSLAVSGARVADVVDHQVGELRRLDPDVVLVSVGANDVTHLTTRGHFRSGYDDLVDAIPDDAVLVLLGVPDMGGAPRLLQPLRSVTGLRGRQLDGVTRAVAAAHDAVYVDIAGETGPTMRSDTGRYFSEDLYHPSDDGYALWADAVLEELKPALQDPPRRR